MITSTDFNPRSPHGERPGRFVAAIYEFVISIHAPRTGSDNQARAHARKGKISIHAPRTGSDPNYIVKFLTIHISIHAPRTGSD